MVRVWMLVFWLGACGLAAASPQARIVAGMSLAEAERKLAAYGAEPIELGISRPITDVFQHYRLRDGRVYALYGRKVAPQEWTISFISEVTWALVRIGHGDGYAYSRVDEVSLDDVSLSACVQRSLRKDDFLRLNP